MSSVTHSTDRVYVANWYSSNVSAIDATTNMVKTTVPAGNYVNDTIAAVDPSPSYSSPPIVNILQVEPQGPTLYPELYRGVVQGNILYVTEQDNVNGNSNLELIDISSAEAPTIISRAAGSGPGMNGIVVNGQYVYVSYYQSGVVQVFDASNPNSLTSVGSIATACSNFTNGGLYGGLALAGDYLYIPCPSGGFIVVLSIANPTSLTGVGVITAQNFTNPTSLAVSGQMLYASEPSEADDTIPGVIYSAVCAYNLASSPVPTTPLACATVGHSPQNIAVEGTTVVASIGDANQLDTIDFSNPASPAVYTAALDPNICIHPFIENMVAFQGDTVFVGCSNSSIPNSYGQNGPGYGVEVIDVTNITVPTLLGTIFGSAGNSFAMIVTNGSYLYLGGYPGPNGNSGSTAGALYTVETGTGTNQDDVTYLPMSVSFANQTVGTNSAAQKVTLSNSGTAALTIYGITFAGTNPGDFAQTNTCGSMVAAGGSCTINVTFTPTAAGARGASLSVADNASGSPQTVPLSGTGQAGQSSANVVFNSIGSSSLFLELGEAAATMLQTTVSGETYQCVWTAANGAASGISVLDPTTNQREDGQSWVAWSIDTGSGGSSCANPGVSPIVYVYLQTDSIVGVRCLFNGCTTVLGSPGASGQMINDAACAPSGWFVAAGQSVVETCGLPANIAAALQTATTVNSAGTDIRPEDAVFATERALWPCGSYVAFDINSITAARYLGLGYSSAGTPIKSYFSGGTFNVTNFTLPTSYSVFRVGAAPVVVHINQTDGTALGAGQPGFADTNITNITSGELASFLDGTYSRTGDLGQASGASEGVVVLIREPISGAYNTMEYNIPNTFENQTSMDVGLNQQSAQVNCSGSSPLSNPLNIPTASGGARQRVIGAGEMENVMFGTGTESNLPVGPVLGWSFWSRPNFQNAYSGTVAHTNTDARYLTVDGVDPLATNYSDTNGQIPVAGNGLLTKVTLSHVIDGSYPIWSFLRLVCLAPGSVGCAAANALASSAQNFVSFGAVTSNPDFVPVASTTFPAYNSIVVRSHFTPPGSTIKCGAVSNGTTLTTITAHKAPECGGDVGGVVYTISGDIDYETDFQTGRYVGEINHRR